MKIGILVFDQVEELDFVGPFEVLSYVNKVQPGTVEVLLLSSGKKEIKAFNGLKFHADRLLENLSDDYLDILIVPGGKGRLEEAKNEAILEYLRRVAPNLKLLASVCTGAFFLAEAGLLEGRKATTHHTALTELEKFSGVEVVGEKIVKNQDIWLSAGVSSGIDLGLEIVKEFFGEEIMKKVQQGIEYKS